MKKEHVKIGSLVRVADEESDNYLKYGVIDSLPENDISGWVKVKIDITGNHEWFTNENWFLPSSLSLINHNH